MGRTVKRLSNLEIDEVSLVDTPANQHGLVAITKSNQEAVMAVFDANGDEVFEEELSDGDLVYNESGEEFVFTEGDPDDEGDAQDYDAEDYAGELVGKGAAGALVARARSGAAAARGAAGNARNRTVAGARRARESTEAHARGAYNRGQEGVRHAGNSVQTQWRAIPAGGRAGIRYGGAALGGVGAAEGVEHYRKSLSEEVLTGLSKALTDDDRDEVIAKAMGYVQDVAEQNAQLQDAVQDLLDQRELESYGAVAKNYGPLGVDDEALAGVLMRASAYLPDQDLAVLDRILSGAGEVTKAYFDEVGVSGFGESGVMDQVYGIANSAVAKGADVTSQEQAVTAIFDTNPAAYDEYEAEQRLR